MRIAVLGGRELAYGFRLTGVDSIELEPGEEARRHFHELSQDEDLAIIVLSMELFSYLNDEIVELRSQGSLPAVVALPDRGEEAKTLSMGEFLESFLGLKV